MHPGWARPWFAVTALCVLAGIGIQLFVSATSPAFFGGSPLNRALNVFAFFTILSNVLVAVTCLLLAVRQNRSSAAFSVLRHTGLVAISVTFVVFHVVLSRLLDLDTLAQAANQLQHTIVPVLAVVGWLAGLRPQGAHLDPHHPVDRRLPALLHGLHRRPRSARIGLVPVPVRRRARPGLCQGGRQRGLGRRAVRRGCGRVDGSRSATDRTANPR